MAQFIRCYGADFYRGGWPTTDGVIPHTLFWLFYANMFRVYAMERLSEMQAVGGGAATIFDRDAAKAIYNQALKDAFPHLDEDA